MSDQTLHGNAREFLSAPGRLATLATIEPDGSPLLAVVWYELRGDAILINSRVGRRWPTNLLRDPRASLVVDDGYSYVAVMGTVEVLDDAAAALEDISALARAYYTPEEAERVIREEFSTQRRISFLLHPQSVLRHDLGPSHSNGTRDPAR
jgi:PPOX class probable F420-dependent enzyme